MHSRATSFAYSAACIFGVSDFVLDGFRKDGMNPAKCITLPNGVREPAISISKVEARAALGFPLDATIVAAIGAMVDFKRYDIAIAAITKARSKIAGSLRFLLVGDGPLMSDLHKQSDMDSIEFLGWRSDVDLIISASDFVLSTSEREAFGLTLIEAAALSRPAVISAIGGQSEVVLDGLTGFHFVAGSVEDCVEKIVVLANSPSLVEELGRSARYRYELLYTESVMNDRMERQLKGAYDPIHSKFLQKFQRPAYGLILLLRSIFRRYFF
jgi:glycosyltransferase involved in cell wall biosynthesis